MSPPSARAPSLVERARHAFLGPPLLESISWPRTVERAFFDAGCERLPEPQYRIDADVVGQRLARLDALDAELVGDDALVRFLKLRSASHRLGAELLLAVGTPRFGELSVLAYGGARSSFLDRDTTNLDFAEQLAARLGRGEPSDEETGKLDAEGLIANLRERLTKRRNPPDIELILDDELGAKAIAGKTRVRIRSDATFDPEEARSLYLHEIETHVFTAQNGALQPVLDFMGTGGPRSTRTQEGLAVFSELYAQALTSDRLRRLVTRVRLVGMAEAGASFIDAYRWLVDQGLPDRQAFTDVARVYRGGVISGGAPFTKDASYLAGLVEVYDFLRLAVAHDRRQVVETLVSGRLAIDELEPLAALRAEGTLAPATYVPSWLKRWDDLLTHFSFSASLSQIDLREVGKRFAWLS